LSAIFSVALVLFMIGFFALTALYGNRLVALFKEKVDIWVELESNPTEAAIQHVVSTIQAAPFVKPNSVTFITREQAAASMRADLGDESLLEDLPNMMRDVVRCNVRADFLTPDSLAEWRAEMKQDSMVADVFYEAASIGNAASNIEKIGYFTLALAILLVFAAVALIHNTIRLALYANRFVIKNQELVGASWRFITRPYLRRGIWNGLFSALMACTALIGVIVVIQGVFPEFKDIQDQNGILAICLALCGLGVLISGLSTWWVVNKFLRMRLEELY
jgi:cell division transport system permease protein